MARNRSSFEESQTPEEESPEVATGASPAPQEEATAVQAQETDTESQEAPGPEGDGEKSFSLPAEDEAAALVRPGIGMEEVPVPVVDRTDPEDYNEQVFAKKREAWEQANPEAVEENRKRDEARS